MSVSHTHPVHSHFSPPQSEALPQGTRVQRFLSNRFACFFALVVFVLVTRAALVQWFLVGGFPSETMVANVLSMLFAGLLIGAIEGRLHSTHKESQQVLGMELDVFLQRARLIFLLGSLAAIFFATFLELGLAIGSAHDLMGILFFVGASLLSLLTGFVTLWISFSWSRWCFGEIRWN